jgi:hypothetical protein
MFAPLNQRIAIMLVILATLKAIPNAHGQLPESEIVAETDEFLGMVTAAYITGLHDAHEVEGVTDEAMNSLRSDMISLAFSYHCGVMTGRIEHSSTARRK